MLNTIAILIIFYLIRLCWSCHKDKKVAEEAQGTPEERRQAEEWAAAMRDKMEARGLGHYLLKDFCFKERLTPDDMKSEVLLQRKMTRMMQDLHAYLCLRPGYTLSVKFDRDNSMDRSGQCDYSARRIDIFPRSYYTAETLMSILAHETAHYFMYQYGLSDPDKDLNERCTDVVSSLMGCSSCRVSGDIGYLNKGQFIAVRNSICAYRSQQACAGRKAGSRNESSERILEQQRLRSQISAAAALLQQTRSVITVKKIPTRTDLTVQDYHRLRTLVSQLECGKYDRSLASCSKQLQGDLANLRTGQQNVMNMCNDLNTMMRIYA